MVDKDIVVYKLSSALDALIRLASAEGLDPLYIEEIYTNFIDYKIADFPDNQDYAIVEFATLEDQYMFELCDMLHGGESEDNEIWIDRIYGASKPKFYGTYRMRNY